MTRKDYVKIANAIAIARTPSAIDAPRAHDEALNIAEAIADEMAMDNSRFDRERFLKACGVQS